jgi:hypothetical protein
MPNMQTASDLLQPPTADVLSASRQHTPTSQGIHLPDPIPANLLPLHLLPRDRQLAPQRLERALVEPREPAPQRLLERALRGRDGAHGLRRRRPAARPGGRVDVLVRLQPHVAVLVVVHVDADAAGQRAAARVEDVPRAPAAVPLAVRQPLNVAMRWTTHQKFCGLNLFATVTIATLLSSSVE